MPLLSILTITLPLVGAGGILVLSLVPRIRSYTCYLALVAAGFTTILLLTLRWIEPVMVVPSLWQPSLLFGAVLALETDAAMLPLALALALITFSAILMELSCAEGPHLRLVIALLALLPAGFVALWAANPLTMIISWAFYDLLRAAGCLAAGSSARTAIRGLVFGGLATLLLWGGALLSDDGAGSELWSLMTPSGVQLTLWAAAGILRLWVYPFHLSAPDDISAGSSIAAPLLLGPVVGWGLWLRLATANGGPIPGGAWVLTLAAVTLAVGGFLAWSCGAPRRMLAWIGVGITGAVLLAAGLAGESAGAVIVAGSVTWALGIALLFLGNGLSREAPWWSIPSLVGALALVGVPLTLGFIAEATLIGGLTRGDRLEWGGAFVVGHLFLIPSLVRWLLLPPPSPLPDRRWPLVVRGVGLGLPVLLLIVAGLHPPLLISGLLTPPLGSLFTMPGLMGWLLWAVSLAGGGILAWQDGKLRPKIKLLLGAVHDLLRLEWLYGVMIGTLERGLGPLRVADEVVGGAGALLWSWLLFLLLLLVWGGK